MRAAARWGTRPFLAAFIIWFAHFMLCWAAVEIWPHQWRANQLAWAFTVVALVAMGVHAALLAHKAARGQLAEPARRLARGATAIATVAVLFTALPSIVFLP